MPSRFEERLRSGPPIVADGGMGALLSGAVPRLRCPEEANLRAPESVVALHASFIRAGAELIETNTFGANRRKLAAHFLEDELERINSTAVRLAREAREVSGADVFIAGSIGPLGRARALRRGRAEPLFAEQAEILEGRGVDLLHARDVLRPRRARRRGRGGALRLVAADRGADDVRRGRPDARRRLGRGRGRAARRAGRGRDRREPQRRPGRGAERARARCSATSSCSRRCRTSASPAWPARASSSRTRRPTTSPSSRRRRARLGRAGSSAAAAARRRPRSRRSGTAIDAEPRAGRAARRSRERELVEAAETAAEETQLARMLREGEFVISVQLDPPLGANNGALVEAARAIAQSGKAHFVDVNDNPRARARMSGVMASVAIERCLRARDDPAPDDARHVDRRPRVAPARRARRGRPQHARRHGRPAGGGRLPGRPGRLRASTRSA